MDYRLKIGFVLDDSLDKTDGVQQYVLTLGRWFSELGHDVQYLVGETKRDDVPGVRSLSKNVKVRFNGNRLSIPLPASRKPIRRLLAQEEFDILHIQMPYSPMLAGRIIKAASPQTAVVGTFHIAPNSRLVHIANWLLRFFIDGSIRRFDEIMSVSAVAQDFAWKTFGIESSLVPNCAKLTDFYDAKPLDAYKNERTIMFLGRLVERKGCMHLLEAVNRMKQRDMVREKYKVIIGGGGPLEGELKRYVKHHDLESIVEFAGFIDEGEKPRYLASADIAVFPSTGGESFGIILLEAMAAARGAVIAGNNPGYASVMSRRPEVLFDPTDTEQFAEKLAELLKDTTLRSEIQAWQRSYVTRFDVANVADDVLALYDSALHKRRE